MFVRDTRHVATIVPTRFVKVNGILHVKWPGENPMKGIPTPLCQIAIPSALSNARVWVKGRLCWTCTTLLSQGEARRFETTEDSGTMGGIPCFLWGGGRGNTSSVTNEGKCRFVFYFINARAFARPSTSLIRMNE